MKTVVIIYTSVTGNTKHVAEVIAERLTRDQGTSDTFSGDAITTVLVNADVEYKRQHTRQGYTGYIAGDAYIVGSTTAASRISDLMREYLGNYPTDMVSGKPCAVYALHAGDCGYVRRGLYTLMKGRGGIPCSDQQFKAPTNFLPFKSYPKTGETLGWVKHHHDTIAPWADTLLASFDAAVADPTRKYKAPKGGVMGGVMGLIPGKKIDSMMRGMMGQLVADPHRCLRCAKCVTVCPYGALAMVQAETESDVTFDPSCVDPATAYYPLREQNTEYVQSRIAAGVNSTRVVVHDQALCHGCYRCIHVCPTAALNPVKRQETWRSMPRYTYTDGIVVDSRHSKMGEGEFDRVVIRE
ncbi:hypothetical protein KIPB_000835 [Kipferlia bialata]|uniref:Uncharacterized protein n=1 Tax=Kipferlia bialata TaxID=797122 RepID=A0A9K3CPT0_9EUKA|nr:hypothetical protein KIPB_000835 [Kipferlia bialata]|eukprot:g835.t1